ncbi:MAG: hypothetical protein EBS49_02465 [Verrucomicrobia bacterium]|nr:hypothetical protein [Verrucomicrobiota bacterium]NBU68478.1 hypothetical protein [Verrucomicrobiota bacterium]
MGVIMPPVVITGTAARRAGEGIGTITRMGDMRNVEIIVGRTALQVRLEGAVVVARRSADPFLK